MPSFDQSSSRMTVKEAAAYLTDLAVQKKSAMSKVALSMPSLGQVGQAAGQAAGQAGQWWGKLDPAIQDGLIGAGAGGALGLGVGSMPDRNDQRHPLSGMLTGALAGGAIGGGAGELMKSAPQIGVNTLAEDWARDKGAIQKNQWLAGMPARAMEGLRSPVTNPLSWNNLGFLGTPLAMRRPLANLFARPFQRLNLDTDSGRLNDPKSLRAGALDAAEGKIPSAKGVDPVLLKNIAELAAQNPNMARQVVQGIRNGTAGEQFSPAEGPHLPFDLNGVSGIESGMVNDMMQHGTMGRLAARRLELGGGEKSPVSAYAPGVSKFTGGDIPDVRFEQNGWRGAIPTPQELGLGIGVPWGLSALSRTAIPQSLTPDQQQTWQAVQNTPHWQDSFQY